MKTDGVKIKYIPEAVFVTKQPGKGWEYGLQTRAFGG